jgi:hypothetical protein
MMREAQALLARMAKQVSSRLRVIWLRCLRWLRSARERERDGTHRDPLASYAAPSHQSKEPPYASLRQ